jgi:hypothetical protein
MPLNVLTIFAGFFLVMGLAADLISLVGEFRRFTRGGKRQVIPMVSVVFYLISCFVGYIYLGWQAAGAALAILVLFHLFCQYTFFFLKRPESET